MIEDMLEEIYGGSVYDGIYYIIDGIDTVLGMEDGGICIGWLGISVSVEHIVCIISDV